ncbi:hypothetical protein [Methanoregula sp.]|uniref:hypothetical protein n=1 Tax=Methanoregula sp. TaxID=2052170 RepID=UPI003C73B589
MLMQETPGPVPEHTGNCCPCCNSARDVIPIVYAVATPQLRAAQRKGKVVIADSTRGKETLYCKNCGTLW